MAVSKRTRFEVLRRDNYACRYCRSDEGKLTIDHVTPVVLGGSDDPSNLVACCVDCNAGKSSSAPDADLVAEIDEDAARWARARERALAAMEKDRQDAAKWHRKFLREWKSWDKDASFLPLDWRDSITRWVRLGLTVDQIIEAHDIACTKRSVRSRSVFAYMAGVLNNRLREIEARTALELVLEATEDWARTD